jgi:preprotein translocase subunit SecF
MVDDNTKNDDDALVDEVLDGQTESSTNDNSVSDSSASDNDSGKEPLTDTGSDSKSSENASLENTPSKETTSFVARRKFIRQKEQKTIQSYDSKNDKDEDSDDTSRKNMKSQKNHAVKKNVASEHSTHNKKNFFTSTYEKHYKLLLIFSVMLLVFSIGVISYKVITTGDFVSKGITLKGGLTITINNAGLVDTDKLEANLRSEFPKSDISVRSFAESGASYGLVAEASDVGEKELLSAINKYAPEVDTTAYSSEITGPSLGVAFFNQTLKAIFVAFVFMSLVIYLYFGHSLMLKWVITFLSILAGFIMFYANSFILYIIPLLILASLIVIYFRDNIPSFAIILCAASDVIFSLAIFDIMGLKLNTAGVAAFLMLVGYSIDTDILLSVRVLKRKEGDVFHRVMGALKTGMMMSISALIAVLTAYFLTSSAVIKEIMFILAIGLFGDIIFTWIQNAGILRWHLEKKGWK